MTQSDCTAIQKFGDEITAQLKRLAEGSPLDKVGVHLSIMVIQSNLCRVQTEAIVESLNKATVIYDAEHIARGEK
jgi:hypothetical protein